MAKTKTTDEQPAATVPVSELADALATSMAQAIETARPQKKNTSNRKKNTPWTPKDGSTKLKLKRKFYQHGVELSEKRHSNEEIALMNKVKPGTYCNGFVKVIKRRDQGINIDYPVRTAAQRLRLINDFGVRSFSELLQRCISEASAPAPVEQDD